MRETYLTFGMWTAAIAMAMWAIALVFWLLGCESRSPSDGGRGSDVNNTM